MASEKLVAEKPKVGDTPSKSRLFKSSSGVLEGKRGDKGSTKKVGHRRSSVPKCGAKESLMPNKGNTRRGTTNNSFIFLIYCTVGVILY